ncbi:MAG: Rrf2 family transcriptional regulator [Actinobacteria bacterium]|nr:Rrf2 family transcriptional regulator [Actinomycetota bacterium]
MRITLTRRGDYAVRAAFDVASHHPQRRKAAQIAASMDIPRAFLSRVAALLTAAGVFEAAAGPRGGYTLAGSPSAISLLDVVEAAEGPLDLTECVLRGGPCSWEDRCAVHDTWAAAQETFRSSLASTSLADLVDEG